MAEHGIDIQGVRHEYEIERDGARHMLSAIAEASLAIKAGEFVSLVGPSGCGKTTLRNAAFGMELRGFPHEARLARAKELLGEAGLSGFESTYVSQLSKGMRQRVALARTFGLPCDFLLMDEPFGALDPQTKLTLQQQLLTLWEKHQGRTVLFVTHDLGEAIVMSDRVVVMSRRPARIKADIRIDLPRPRMATELLRAPEFHRLYAYLWGELGGEITTTEQIGANGIAQ